MVARGRGLVARGRGLLSQQGRGDREGGRTGMRKFCLVLAEVGCFEYGDFLAPWPNQGPHGAQGRGGARCSCANIDSAALADGSHGLGWRGGEMG